MLKSFLWLDLQNYTKVLRLDLVSRQFVLLFDGGRAAN